MSEMNVGWLTAFWKERRLVSGRLKWMYQNYQCPKPHLHPGRNFTYLLQRVIN